MRLRTVYTIQLGSRINTNCGVKWSSSDLLAVATNKNIIISSIIPDPTNTQNELNLNESLLPLSSDCNPYLDEIGIDYEDLLEHVTRKEKMQIYSMVNAFTKPEQGKTLLNQVSEMEWLPDGVCRMPLIMTLTTDHLLKVFGQNDDGSWSQKCDLSKILRERLKAGKWMECQDDTSNGSKFVNWKERFKSLSIDKIALSDFDTERCILVTSSANGLLVLWELLGSGNAIQAEVKQVLRTKIGRISALKLHKLRKGQYVLIVGAARCNFVCITVIVTATKVQFSSQNLCTALDLDNCSKITTISVVPNPANNIIRIALGNGINLIIADIRISGTTSVDCLKKRLLNTSSTILDIVPFTSDSLLVSPVSGPPLILSLNDMTLNPVHLDMDSQLYEWCGFQPASNQTLYIGLQHLAANHDHLVKRKPDRVVFMAAKKQTEILKELETVKSSDLRSVKVCLEVLRLSWAEAGFSMEFLREKMRNVESLSGFQLQLFLWLSKQELSRSRCSETSTELNLATDILRQELFKRHINKVKNCSKDPKMKEGSLRFLTKFNLEVSNDLEDIDLNQWSCKLCDSALSHYSLTEALCDKNHSWPICCLSLNICDDPVLLTCSWCKSPALAKATQEMNTFTCPLCSGPVQNR